MPTQNQPQAGAPEISQLSTLLERLSYGVGACHRDIETQAAFDIQRLFTETKAQRDELLEVCKKAAIIIENENTAFKESIREAAIEVLSEINAAIAKATERRAL